MPLSDGALTQITAAYLLALVARRGLTPQQATRIASADERKTACVSAADEKLLAKRCLIPELSEDECEIADETSEDAIGDGVPDECSGLPAPAQSLAGPQAAPTRQSDSANKTADAVTANPLPCENAPTLTGKSRARRFQVVALELLSAGIARQQEAVQEQHINKTAKLPVIAGVRS